MSRSVLITGAGGYLGGQLTLSLAAEPGGLDTIVAADLHLPDKRLPGVEYEVFDIRDPAMTDILRRHHVDTVVHLAAIVTAGRNPDRELEHSIDVGGTRNVMDSCLAAGVGKVIISSSGAAYGYHADNPDWLREDDAIRGNVEFSYSDHKRQIEEMLAEWRREHPERGQLILRLGTILGRIGKGDSATVDEFVRLARTSPNACFSRLYDDVQNHYRDLGLQRDVLIDEDLGFAEARFEEQEIVRAFHAMALVTHAVETAVLVGEARSIDDIVVRIGAVRSRKQALDRTIEQDAVILEMRIQPEGLYKVINALNDPERFVPIENLEVRGPKGRSGGVNTPTVPVKLTLAAVRIDLDPDEEEG